MRTFTCMKNYEKIRGEVEEEIEKSEWGKTMKKVSEIINFLWMNFENIEWWGLSRLQIKLSWYKFYLADFVPRLHEQWEYYSSMIKSIKASSWEIVSKEITAKKGRVSNKEQIENEIFIINEDNLARSLIYSSMHYKYKIKISAINDVITSITQRLAELKRQMSQPQG